MGRLPVEGRSGRHVVGYIGDGHGELPPPGARVAVDRVVEVLRVHPVDGHQGEVAEVGPAVGDIRDPEREPLRLGERILRPDVGDPVGTDGDLRRHAGPFGVPQALDDAPGPLVVPALSGRGLGELDHHHLPIPPLSVRDRDVVGKVPVVGRHERHASRAKEAPDHHLVVALDYLEHHPSVPGAQPAAAPPGEPHLAGDPVSVHEAPHLAGREEQVVAPVVPGEEPVPVAVGDHPPFDHTTRVHDLACCRPREFRSRAADGPAAGAPFRREIVIGGSIASCHSGGAAVHCRPFRGPRWRNW